MGWSDFEMSQFFIAENSKQGTNFNQGFLTYCRMLIVIGVSSNKLWKIGLTNSIGFVV